MDKQKEINEIARIICKYPNEQSCDNCNHTCRARVYAERVINAGYGSIEQGLTDFVERLKSKAVWRDTETCDDSYYNLCVMLYDIDKTLKEFLNNDR